MKRNPSNYGDVPTTKTNRRLYYRLFDGQLPSRTDDLKQADFLREKNLDKQKLDQQMESKQQRVQWITAEIEKTTAFIQQLDNTAVGGTDSMDGNVEEEREDASVQNERDEEENESDDVALGLDEEEVCDCEI